MNRARMLSCVLCVAGVSLAGIAGSEEAKKPAAPAKAQAPKPAAKAEAPKAAEAPPAPPKPGPEHEHLKKAAGVWDATVEMSEAPGKPPAVSKGTETSAMIAGGLWLVTDFKSEMMGQPFEGHGVSGYDPAKKKYVGTWVDSWSSSVGVSEGSFDPATKKETSFMDMVDPAGKPTKMKMEVEWKDDDTRVFTMWGPGPDGKPFPGLKITYKRRK
jgi:hypothetical protein